MNLLDKTKSILDQRQKEYGDVGDNVRKIIGMFNILTGLKLSYKHYYLFFLIVKLVREESSHKEDNLIDIIGYSNHLNKQSDK